MCFSKEKSERDLNRRFSLQDDYVDSHLVSSRNKLISRKLLEFKAFILVNMGAASLNI